jgi:tight adherence protein B
MNGTYAYILLSVLGLLAIGGMAFAFAGMEAEKTRKRMAAVSKPSVALRGVSRGGLDAGQQRRKNMQAMLMELEKQASKAKKRPTLRRQIEQAGLEIGIRDFGIASAVAGLIAAMGAFISGAPLYAVPLAGFGCGLGLPRWALQLLKMRREKAFTREFAPAIDAIVRSVKSGLPVNEALKLVSTESGEPVAGEFMRLVEGLKLGVTMEDGLKRMYERMPTPEVNFLGIVLTIQAKSGGNLSEALSNLSAVLRDRKRLQNKIKAMSSEAKTGAMIIGSLPPGVAMMVYLSTPDYIMPLFTTDMGNLMLLGCAVWMSAGVLVMAKMVRFKY